MRHPIRVLAVSFVLGTALQLAGCGGAPVRPELPMRAADPGRVVVETARQQVGAPYHYGGEDPRGFDCSGLVQYAYWHAGIKIPRTTYEQRRHARPVSLSRLRPGDILFFRLSPPKISHVGIYVGGDRFIHAPSSGKHVSYASLKDIYWRRHLVGAGRFY